jgi:chromosome segregation ATPase
MIPNKPRPNPAWRIWKTKLDRLTEQRDQAQANAAAAHARLVNGGAAVSQITAEVQTDQQQVAVMTAVVQATQQAIGAAQQRRQAAQTEVAKLGQWSDEIVRDPLIRKTLEPLAAELSSRVADLEDAHAGARVQNEIAKETLMSLTARRDQLTAALNTMNANLPALLEDLRVKKLALSSVSRGIQARLKRGPRA